MVRRTLVQPRRAPLLRRAPALLLQAPPPLLLVLRPAAAQHRAAHTHPSGGLNRTRTRLRRLIGHELRREVRQDKLLRRLQALWDRRPPEERAAFLHSLATEFGTSDEDAAAALHLVEEGAGAAGAERAAALLEARRLLAPEYEQLAAGLAERPAGLRLLLDLRSATLKLLRQRDTAPAAAAALRPFEASLQAQLRAWFSPGLLAHARVSWQRTPPPLLERVIAAEAVHSITSWCEKRLFLSHLYTKNHLFTKTDSGQTWKKAEGKGIVRRDDLKVRKRHFARDFLLNTIVFPPRQARDPDKHRESTQKKSGVFLQQRLGHNRRVWVLTHPALPAEPLAMLEVALTPSIAPSVAGLLREDTWQAETSSQAVDERWGGSVAGGSGGGTEGDGSAAVCAIFYSISSTQPGLGGIDLGSLLIKRMRKRSFWSTFDANNDHFAKTGSGQRLGNSKRDASRFLRCC
jgi:hypothetical protein